MKTMNEPDLLEDLIDELQSLPEPQRVETLNHIRRRLHAISPFKDEPVDNIQWVSVERIEANDYNPNAVAPPEMELLALSVREDGYTQPIVTWDTGERYEVIDGFHRNRVGREDETVSQRLNGYLPVVVANDTRLDRGDRIASTIRHNRARGKHQIGAMADIVLELSRRNWSDKKIGKHLGMEPDEVLRLSQITGLAEMFADREFSEAWEADVILDTDTLEHA
jgi:ParB-like chromosome segregation protein Spo0J